MVILLKHDVAGRPKKINMIYVRYYFEVSICYLHIYVTIYVSMLNLTFGFLLYWKLDVQLPD